jgi:hypothetical protein
LRKIQKYFIGGSPLLPAATTLRCWRGIENEPNTGKRAFPCGNDTVRPLMRFSGVPGDAADVRDRGLNLYFALSITFVDASVHIQ